jgi:hypothetical protein
MFESLPNAKQRAFLAAFAECGVISHAAAAAGIHRERHYDWLAEDPAYAREFALARHAAGDLLEAEAIRRGRDGVTEPVLYKGEPVMIGGEPLMRRRYADRLLALVLAAHKPEYSTKTIEHKGAVAHTHRVDLSALNDDELDALDRLLSKTREPDRPGSDRGGTDAAQAEQAGDDVPGDGTV